MAIPFTVPKASSAPLGVVPGVLVAVLLSVCSAFAQAPRAAAQEAAVTGLAESREGAILALVRELTEWRNRALDAESLVFKFGLKSGEVRADDPSIPAVLRTVPEERILLVSVGRESGALPGAVLVVGDGVYARVVEARASVSAALLDQSFAGRIASLEGAPVRLAVR